MTTSEPLLRVRNLQISVGPHEAGRVITEPASFDLQAGKTLGIVGESGSGKSMTARALVGLKPKGVHASGEVWFHGRQLLGASERELTAIRGRGIGFVFQDPFTMLNPLMRAGDQISELLRGENGRRLSRTARRAEAVRLLAEVGIADPAVASAYPFELSGGMRQRVGIAAALALDPEVLIADEPTTALDVTIQAEILERLRSLQVSRGLAIILITHDLRVAFSTCDDVVVMYAGSILERGPSAAMQVHPMHPYTEALLRSEPPSDRRLPVLNAIAGEVPPASTVRGQCAFASRCDWVKPACTEERPLLAEVSNGRASSCIRIAEIKDDLEAQLITFRAGTEGTSAVAGSSDENPGLVTVLNVSKTFGGRRQVAALEAVSLTIGPGECVGLVGESGSGKSTLGRCLLGLETPDSGSVIINGIDATDYRSLSRDARQAVRASIQMIFQDSYSTLNPARTIGSTLAEALKIRRPSTRTLDGPVADLLSTVGLPVDYARRRPATLSGGERQRVAIARALAAEPRLIVCDEPVSALDVSVQAQVLTLLLELQRTLGISYLFITHDLAVVRQVADRLYVLRGGSVVESGFTNSVLDSPSHPYTAQLLASAL